MAVDCKEGKETGEKRGWESSVWSQKKKSPMLDWSLTHCVSSKRSLFLRPLFSHP